MEATIQRIAAEFSRRGWRPSGSMAATIVRHAMQSPKRLSARNLSLAVPRTFLTANGITRAEVQNALARVLADLPVLCVASSAHGGRDAVGGHDSIVIERLEIVEKQVQINNSGVFAGNIDSQESSVQIDRQQQQVLSNSQDEALRAHLDDPAIRQLLASPAPAEEKIQAASPRLAKLAGVGLDVATSFLAKLLGEIVRPH